MLSGLLIDVYRLLIDNHLIPIYLSPTLGLLHAML